MDNDDFDRHRLSFGAAAQTYEQSRPEYPDAAISWLVGRGGLRVLDLGAGTGKLTRGLVAAGHDVIAVDPDESMLAALTAASPHVPAYVGSSEAIPLPDGSVDVVVAGQAYHWFSGEPAHAEIARVLRADGIFGPVWNFRDDHLDWVAQLSELIGITGDAATSLDATAPRLGRRFGAVKHAEFSHAQTLDAEGLATLVASRSYVLTLSPDDRAAVLEQVAELAATHPDLRGRDTFDLPYLTHAYRAARR